MTRLKEHRADYCSSVSCHVFNKSNGDRSNVHIDIIDNFDMNEDLIHLLNHPLKLIHIQISKIHFLL